MKEALYYTKLEGNKVQCNLCPNNCIISDGHIGSCHVRQNIKGKLYSLVYGKAIALNVDPIGKKPLFHFMPGTNIYSFGTVGCNLHCKHCQNWEISQPNEIIGTKITPREIVDEVIKEGCKSIAYTYTEPTIFYEYILETAKLARKKGIKNVMVTNGYINKEPLEELYPLIDAANVDIKGFTEKFYKDVTSSRLQPVLDTLINLKKFDTWVELTNLIIPTLNDDSKQIKKMCSWIVKNLGSEVPLHFSRFFPLYKLTNLPATSADILFKAHQIAKKSGLKYVYIGNMYVDKEENTYCPKCNELIIARSGFEVNNVNLIQGNKCPKCKTKIAGIF